MKAAVLRGQHELALEDVDKPTGGPDQVLVRVTNSGVCGTDLRIYDGSVPVRYPLIMGHEISGEVVAGGDDRIRVGDRVIVDPCFYCGRCLNCLTGQTNLCRNGGLVGRDANGGFADYFVAPLAQAHSLPKEADSGKAPLIQVLSTCIHAQRFLNISPGQSVVVMGLGVTGQLHVQLARAHGAHPVIGVSRSAWKRRLAEQLGADLTLVSGAEAMPGVLEATNGQGADVVIVATDALPAVADGILVCRPGATLGWFGLITATENRLPLYQLYYKELKIFNPRAARPEDFPAAIDLVARGVVKFDSLISHQLPITQLPAAMQMLESDLDHRMKIILDHN